MRMGGEGPSAADVVGQSSERDLANIIFLLGEERHSRSVARAIVRARAETPITTTARLADIVASVVRMRPDDIHPATRTFQALRIFVNDELGELGRRALPPPSVSQTGRPAGRSCRSIRSRTASSNRFSRTAATRVPARATRPSANGRSRHFRVLTKRPVVADEAEIARNPRARSAKLRAAERSATPARRTI